MILTVVFMFFVAQIWRWSFANFHWFKYYHSIKLFLAGFWGLEFNHDKTIIILKILNF